MSILTRAAKGIWRRIDPSDKARIKRMIKDPPPVEKDHILFVSSEDYSGNPRALFLYMIDHGLNEKYKITWLFEDRGRLFDFGLKNVRSVPMYTDNTRAQRTAAAQKAVLSARYVFCSHNVNWARVFRPEQTVVSLWHGCGYKGVQKSDRTKVIYDYLMVTGKKYIDIFREVMDDPDGNILDLGYPRNEMLFTDRSGAKAWLEEMKQKAGAKKAVIWMPTYRKSAVARLSTDVELGETALPIVPTWKDLKALDVYCREKGLLLVIKKHHLQLDGSAEEDLTESGSGRLTNTVFIDSPELAEHDADLYEFIGGTDALLTDYSSVAIDYMLLGRPMAYTLDDFERYEEARGFSFEGVKEYMPGHHITDIAGLKVFIDDVSEGNDPHAEWRERILPEMQTYRDGFSKRILDYFHI